MFQVLKSLIKPRSLNYPASVISSDSMNSNGIGVPDSGKKLSNTNIG